jgi:two-component system sensor histidine kinase KdpD
MTTMPHEPLARRRQWTGYAWAALATAACSLAGWAMRDRFHLVNIAMVYLLAVVAIALRFRRGPAIAASVLAIAAFDVLFVPPQGSFGIDDLQYLLSFAIILVVGVIVSDLTESVHRRASAQAKAEMEAETERIRSALLASISHDLRTPLAVMSGASSSLAERGEQLGAAERQALARSVFEQARALSEQVDKLLQMTRLESGTIALERDWDSLGEIAGAVLRRLKGTLAEHHLLVELPDDLPLVRVNAGLIAQALGNLVENAARHTPRGTVVRLRAQSRGDEMVVSVEDSGPGLAFAEMERVFAKFHQGVKGGSRGGMGLGLAICRAIVRLHGGRAWAEHLPAGGIAFRFTLPLEKVPPVPSEAEGA